MEDRIEQSILIRSTVERVWSEVSQPGWWVPSDAPTAASADPGQVVVRESEHVGRFEVEVVALRPPTYAAFRWASEFSGEALRDGITTLVEFTVEAVPEGARVRVVESGFGALQLSPEERSKAANQNTGGWQEELRALRRRAEGVAAR